MPTSTTSRDSATSPGLARGALSALEAFGQSLAATGPSIAIGGTIPAICLTAGRGAFWSVVVGTSIALVVAVVVAQFARRAVGAGSLYSYVSLGLGRGAAFAAGWGIVLGYVGIAAACLVGGAVYLGALLDSAGLPATGTAAQLVLLVLVTAVSAVLPARGARLSARAGIVFEVVSLLTILGALVATVAHFGFTWDAGQFSGEGIQFDKVMLGAVLAVAVFVGFESAGSLGAETRNPYRSIPRAILATVLGAGVLYLVSVYIETLGFQQSAELASSAAPLNELSETAGVGWLSPLLNLGVAVSAVACAAASVNAAARTLYSLSSEGVLPLFLARTHPRHRTPHRALYLLAAASGLLPLVLISAGSGEIEVYAWTAAFGTFGYLLAYLLTALSLPRFLLRRGEPVAAPLLASVLAVTAIVYVIYKNVSPVPPWPVNLLPYLFAIIVALGLVWYGVLHRRSPERAVGLGRLVEATPVSPSPDTEPLNVKETA